MKRLDEAHKEFVEHLRGKKRASATVLAYGKDIQQLVQFLNDLKKADVTEVAAEDIRTFLAKLEKEGYTQKSISRKLNSTKTFFRFLKVQELITDDPATLVDHPKFDTKPPRILSPIEYRALRDAARDDARIAAVIEILLQTGIRIGELANIRTDDVYESVGQKEGSLFIRSQENRGERTVPLNKAAETALKRYLEVRPKTANKALFVTKTGRPLLVRNIRTAIDRYYKRAGISGAKVNDLRHTWVAHHLTAGTSLVLISKIAGHKRLSTTERYLTLITTPKGEEKVKLEEL
ncbi:MAG: tyrosine-type recombinase/integrase [Candidatus Curtissbacteria bacterium]|nr:tyrosine-type recombinase/integrase [Candidatus Curtissbacteria bacterium]